MIPENLPAFAKMILKRNNALNINEESSRFPSELKTQSFLPENTKSPKIQQNRMQSVYDSSVQISQSHISDISFSVLDDDAEQIVDLHQQVQELQRENNELRHQNKVLQTKLQESQDTSEIDALSEELFDVKSQLENERAQRKLAEDNITYLKRELELKSKNVKANIKIIESLQIKNMKLQELVTTLKGESVEQSSYAQAIESEMSFQSSARSSSSGRPRSARSSGTKKRKRSGFLPSNRPEEMSNSELEREIEKLSSSYYQIKNDLDEADYDPQGHLKEQLESEFNIVSKRLSQLRFEKKLRDQDN